MTAHNKNSAEDSSEPESSLKFISFKETWIKVDISRSVLYEWIDEDHPNFNPDFPQPVPKSKRSSRRSFVLHEVEGYMRRQMMARGGDARQ